MEFPLAAEDDVSQIPSKATGYSRDRSSGRGSGHGKSNYR
jgi:hypothetical protein